MTDVLPFTDGELAAIRADFPILARTVRDGRPLVYLDSGATSHKPTPVLDAERAFYEQHNAAVHRGAHQLARGGHRRLRGRPARPSRRSSGRRPTRWCSPRTPPRRSTSSPTPSPTPSPADEPKDARFVLGPGDEILVTEMEHHANLVPWQELARRTGATLRWVPRRPTTGGSTSTRPRRAAHRAHQGLRLHPRLQRARHGQPGPRARRRGRTPSARSPSSTPASRCRTCAVDVADLGVDFIAFSGHKMFGPHGRRRALGPQRAARRHAAVPHRRLDDRDRHDGALDLRAGAAEVRGRRAQRRAGRRAWPPRCDWLEASSASTASPPTRTSLVDAAARRGLAERAVGARRRSRPRHRPRAAPSRSSSTACTPTTSGRCSTTPASPSGWATTARGRCTARSGAAATTRATLRRLQHARRGRRAARGARPRAAMFGVGGGQLMDLYQELILEHSKRPHHAGLREPFDAEVHHVNPTCGDEVTLRVDVTGTGPTPSSRDISYDALGCSISVACTSVLAEEVIGHPVRRGARDLRGDARDADLQGRGPRRRGRHR